MPLKIVFCLTNICTKISVLYKGIVATLPIRCEKIMKKYFKMILMFHWFYFIIRTLCILNLWYLWFVAQNKIYFRQLLVRIWAQQTTSRFHSHVHISNLIMHSGIKVLGKSSKGAISCAPEEASKIFSRKTVHNLFVKSTPKILLWECKGEDKSHGLIIIAIPKL